MLLVEGGGKACHQLRQQAYRSWMHGSLVMSCVHDALTRLLARAASSTLCEAVSLIGTGSFLGAPATAATSASSSRAFT